MLRRQLKYYFVKSLEKFRKFKEKQEMLINNDRILSNKVDLYVKSREGKCTTIKMILEYLHAHPDGLIPQSI
jgi:hypothetical protein